MYYLGFKRILESGSDEDILLMPLILLFRIRPEKYLLTGDILPIDVSEMYIWETKKNPFNRSNWK